jgi:predicted alpha/beta-hydrolase family hydrolase
MTIAAEKITVKVGEFGSVTALLYAAPKRGRKGKTIVLGHGAGANQLSGFMVMVANELAARGLDVVTFNFLYTEKGRGAPDHRTKLETCYNAVIEAVRADKRLKGNRLVIGGKSMGGRIASQVAAAGLTDIAGLVFLGYPLHPPGNPEKLRKDHLKNIRSPMLFMQGSRDAFGTPGELRDMIAELSLPATLYEIAGGDHSFKVLKSSPLPQPEVYEAVMDEIVRWLSS